MSPVTHFLTGWVFANSARIGRRDRALVTLSVVVPDVDGLGIIAELLTRNSQHPLLWFSHYHHSLHNLAFAIAIALLAFVLAEQRWKTTALCFLGFPPAFDGGPAGVAGAGRGPVADPVSGAVFFRMAVELARAVESERLAKLRDHNSAAGLDPVPGLGERVFAAGNRFQADGSRVRDCLAPTLPTERCELTMNQASQGSEVVERSRIFPLENESGYPRPDGLGAGEF
jgi:hypothetical protein